MTKLLLMFTLALTLVGCWGESDTENAIEDAGEGIEQTVDDMGDDMEDMADDVEDSME